MTICRVKHLLDAAIRVLGERGVRAVTHRAVDAEAGVGAGSTANYFSTREALFAAIVERFAERERQNFEELATTVVPTTPPSWAAPSGPSCGMAPPGTGR